LTGRPSNTFNKVNYAALNKADGSRNKYISRFDNGMILELDYDAYHLRIIADMVDYVLPETSIHEYLGKQYFGKEKLSPQEYSESKEISFRILYGGIPKEFLSIPFFNKVNDFIFKFWNIYIKERYLKKL
jgi:DNA polymerase I-like protein with 3'-5' exonuclease and polymerase domains